MKSVKIIVKGDIQQAGFRYHAMNKAISLGISGFVVNLPDGSVQIEAEGESKKVNKFIEWCHIGPSKAKVSDVEFTYNTLKNYNSFAIAYIENN